MAHIGARRTTGWRATAAVAMSSYMEAGSIIAIATSLGFWQQAYGISDLGIGLLAAFSSNAFGAAIGAALGGPLSDRYGRKFIYMWDLLVYMLGILIAVLAVGFPMLLIGFVITGIAVGAGVPASWTYIAELAPTGRRAFRVGTAQVAWSMGPLVGFALAAALAPLGLVGSRIVFAHLFVVAAVTWWFRQGLPESDIWREQRNGPAVGRQRLRDLLGRRRNVTAILFLIGVYSFWNIVAGQAGIFQPRVYAAAGVDSAVEQDLLQVLVWGMTVVGTVVFMTVADRWSRRPLYAIGAVLGILAWFDLVFFASAGLPALLVFAVVWGFSCGIGAQAFYALWTSELFATPYRASAQGLLFFVARIAVGLLSYWFPTLLTQLGAAPVGLILIGFLTVALVVGTVWAPDTRGKSLQEIEQQRYGEVVDRGAPATV